jgi:hypothetical protein
MQELVLDILRLGYGLLLVWLLWTSWISWNGSERRLLTARRQRHPQSPRDCPVCRAAHGLCETQEQRVVESWARQKSQRGRPKVVETDG